MAATISVVEQGKDVYGCNVDISKEQWLEFLQDPEIVGMAMDTLLKFYRSPEHKNTCKGVAGDDSPQSPNPIITQFAKRVSNKLNLVIDYNGKQTYWPVPMKEGRLLSDKHFEWTLRDELVDAIREWLMLDLLKRYKKDFLNISLSGPYKKGEKADELYKWRLITDCKGKTEKEIIQNFKTRNIIDVQRDNKVLSDLLIEKPQQLFDAFGKLKDENITLSDRLAEFKTVMAGLCGEKYNSKANDERTAAAFLACWNPQKYTFYKDEIYRNFCSYMAVSPQKAGLKYSHYLQLLESLVQAIQKDAEITHKFVIETNGLVQSDLLTAQNILWQMKDMMKEKMFTWIPFYTELANKLLDYKDRRKELVEFVYSLGECSNFIKKDDGSKVDDIDPYTVFSIFNRQIGIGKRKQIAKMFKEYFSIEADIPEDFCGVPVMNNQKSVFFYRQTSLEQIPLLWDLFTFELNDEKSSLIATFDSLQQFHGIRWNLTIGMYWVKPNVYMPLDAPSRNYLHKIGVDVVFNEMELKGDKYLLLLNIIEKKIGSNDIQEKSIPEISYNAVKEFVGDFTLKDFCKAVEPLIKEHGFSVEKKGRGGSYLWINVGDIKATYDWHYEFCADKNKKADHDGSRIFVEIHFEGANNRQYEKALSDIKEIQSFPWEKDAIGYRINSDGYGLEGDINEVAKAAVQELVDLKNLTIDRIMQTAKKMESDKAKYSDIDKYTNILRLKKNIILQGAPGTGKTYNTAALALAICGEQIPEDHEDVMKRYEELQKEGRIGFVTFHQSMDYEDFVEGIKPKVEGGNVSYNIEDGIFKKMCENAKNITTERKSEKIDFSKTRVLKMSLGEKGKDDAEIFDYCLENNVVGLGWGGDKDFSQCNKRGDFKSLDDTWGAVAMEIFKSWMQIGDVILISDGTKSIKAIARIVGDYEFHKDVPIVMCQFRKVEWLYTGDLIPISKLYNKNLSQQSIYGFYSPNKYGKPDFNGSIKVDVLNDIITGKVDDEIPQNYVLIIDEINRGNISKIFGELITLLESDKRIGGDHPIRVTLPYSKKLFGVPSNLYIIGTMNTTDRSVGNIDYAVRRRFAFATLKADKELVKHNPIPLAVELFEAVEGFIKNKDELDFDDLMVGHSYFFAKDESELKLKWQYEILPLLNEYIKDDILRADRLKTDMTIEEFVGNFKSEK